MASAGAVWRVVLLALIFSVLYLSKLAFMLFIFSVFVWFIGFEAVHQLVEVNLVALEFGAIDAGEFSFAVDGYATSAAHTGSVNHNRVQADDSGDIQGPGQFRYGLHHNDGAGAVNGVNLPNDFSQGVCYEAFFA